MGDTYVLQTKLGLLKGHTKTSRLSNKIYYAFQGIPYAKPPLGSLRFKAPQAFGSWEGLKNATEDMSCTMQPPTITPWPDMDWNQISMGKEDCLYLNVYVPEHLLTSRSKSPVMFYIHGGGFLGGEGTSKLYGPDYIMTEDVILVSINYRCGAFGFLSLENEEVPGNAGLKDQNLALQWVKDNIDSFGGDPNNVTIFGVSAGGASVQYHLLSQTSKGLFHKAIIQSGCSNNHWALQSEPRKIAVRLAKHLGCTSENNNEILNFLQSVPAVDIVEATTKMDYGKKELLDTSSVVFSPCVEVAGINPFLTDTPDNLMKNGQFNKVPVILGCTMDEGNVITWVIGSQIEDYENVNKSPELLVPPFLGLKSGTQKEIEAGKEIQDFYFRNNSFSFERFQGDIHFNIAMAKTRSYLLSEGSSPLFTYLFTNNSLLEITKEREGPDEETGHGSDITYLFVYGLYPELELTPEYKEAIRKHVKAWTRFAYYGDPNCTELGEVWVKDSISKPRFMDIGTTWKMKEGTLFAERMLFWNNLVEKYTNHS